MNEESSHMRLEEVHKSSIKAGDMIIHNGRLVTVCRCDIRLNALMGRTIFGDSYHLGYKPVIKAHIEH